MRYLSVCSGIEAVSVAWQPLGWTPVAFAEVDRFASAVLAHRYPAVPNLGDLTQITPAQIAALGGVDLLVGGPPCQDYSVSGQRQGMQGARGGLTLAFGALAHALEVPYVLFENVPGLLSSAGGRDFARLLGALTGWPPAPPVGGWRTAGVAWGPHYGLAWRVLDAQYFGVPQRRRRVFLLAARAGDWRTPLAALWQLPSIPCWEDWATHVWTCGLTPAGVLATAAHPGWRRALRAAGCAPADAAPAAGGCLTLQLPETPDPDPMPATQLGDVLEPFTAALERYVVSARACRAMLARARRRGKRLPELLVRALHAGACEDSDGDGAVVALASDAMRVSGALGSGTGGWGYDLDRGALVPVAFKASYLTRGKDSAPASCTPTLTADADRGDQDVLVLVAFTQNQRDELRTRPVVGALVAQPGLKQQTYLAYRWPRSAAADQLSYLVRRLTPRECERLQGLPDDWTQVPYTTTRTRPALPRSAADSPRYRAIGNSMAVPCVRWIGDRLMNACRTITPRPNPQVRGSRWRIMQEDRIP